MLTQEMMCPLIHAHPFFAHESRFTVLVDEAPGFFGDHAFFLDARESRITIVIDDAFGFFRRDGTHAFKAREIPGAIRVFRTRVPRVAEGLASSDLIEKLNFSTHTHILIEQLGKEFLGIDV
jgi:hypothetical protein